MKIAVTGGTGFVGRALCRALLSRRDQVLILTRRPESCFRIFSGHPNLQPVFWSFSESAPSGAWSAVLDGCDAVVHLAGEPVFGKRWTEKQKALIRDSRVLGTRAIVEAIGRARQKPKVLVSASAVGYYGDRGEEDLTENSPPGDDFLAKVCVAWEREAAKVQDHGVRWVSLRIGIVLEKTGGALKHMAPAFKMFVGGPAGSGKQWISWIHREDLVRLILFCLERQSAEGPINAVAPQAVRMGEFCKTLGRVLRRPSWLPAPAKMLRFVLGEAAEIILASQKVLGRRAHLLGFKFRHPVLLGALSSIYRPSPPLSAAA